MPYYHVYIIFEDKKRKENTLFSFDCSEGGVKQYVASPYMKNKTLLIVGRIVHPSDIIEIAIYKSEKKFQELTLPNGKSPLDTDVNNTYIARCFDLKKVKGVSVCTMDFITSPPAEKEDTKSLIGLMESATFLGLNTNWSSSTCALQLQEVAMTLVAKKKNIKLDKANVERILNKKIEDLSFNDQYKAFSKQVKALFNVDMPILTTHLRKMRTKVLHEGYNPKPEETDSIVRFTTGLLKKLEDIS